MEGFLSALNSFHVHPTGEDLIEKVFKEGLKLKKSDCLAAAFN